MGAIKLGVDLDMRRAQDAAVKLLKERNYVRTGLCELESLFNDGRYADVAKELWNDVRQPLPTEVAKATWSALAVSAHRPFALAHAAEKLETLLPPKFSAINANTGKPTGPTRDSSTFALRFEDEFRREWLPGAKKSDFFAGPTAAFPFY
eukprot:6441584-Prymnesium_polylepis.2